MTRWFGIDHVVSLGQVAQYWSVVSLGSPGDTKETEVPFPKGQRTAQRKASQLRNMFCNTTNYQREQYIFAILSLGLACTMRLLFLSSKNLPFSSSHHATVFELGNAFATTKERTLTRNHHLKHKFIVYILRFFFYLHEVRDYDDTSIQAPRAIKIFNGNAQAFHLCSKAWVFS
jgi:hypothetical protein